jgi:hypothetical protein
MSERGQYSREEILAYRVARASSTANSQRTSALNRLRWARVAIRCCDRLGAKLGNDDWMLYAMILRAKHGLDAGSILQWFRETMIGSTRQIVDRCMALGSLSSIDDRKAETRALRDLKNRVYPLVIMDARGMELPEELRPWLEIQHALP